MNHFIFAFVVVTTSLVAEDSGSAVTRHGLAQFQKFCGLTDGSFCFSPLSSQQVAALLTLGATGQTQQELVQLAQVHADAATRAAAQKELFMLLKPPAGSASVFHVANTTCVAQGTELLPGFLDTARDQFALQDLRLPSTDSVESAQYVNEWGRKQTGGRLASIVGSRDMPQPGGLLLINTILLKSAWRSPFNPRHSKMLSFSHSDGSTPMLPTLRKLEAESFNYSEGPGWQAISLPCEAKTSFVILLPVDAVVRDKIEARLNEETLKQITSWQREDVIVQMPKFTTHTELNLGPMWEELGARRVFKNGVSELTNLATSPTYVSQVKHHCVVDVSERGVEAAAATVAAAEPFGAMPTKRIKRFIANRPFLWWIKHDPSEALLFMGRYTGP